MGRTGAYLAAALAVSAGPALALDGLPDNSVDALLRISLAATAQAKCAWADVSDGKVQAAMLAVMQDLAAEGINPVVAVEFLKTEDGVDLMAEREAALRAKHGVAETGVEALCDAIHAEAGEDAALADLVGLK